MACRVIIRVIGPQGLRTTCLENSEPLATVSFSHLPAQQQLDGTPREIANVVFMFWKECAAVIPLVEGISFAYGGLLQPGGYYDIVPDKPPTFRGYIIYVRFIPYAETRLYPHLRPSYYRGDRSRLAAQAWDFEGRSGLLSPSWPECSVLRACDMDPLVRDLPLWLPGPPRAGRTGYMEEVMTVFTREQRGFTQNSTVGVTFPYDSYFWFTEAVHALPPSVDTIILLVHDHDDVRSLSGCLEAVSSCSNIEELRVEFQPTTLWIDDIAVYIGNLRRIMFRVLCHPLGEHQLLRFFRNNENLVCVHLQGRATCFQDILRWLRSPSNKVHTLQLHFEDSDGTDAALIAVGQMKTKLVHLGLNFAILPTAGHLHTAIRNHSSTLQSLMLGFPEQTRRHRCGSRCERYLYLPLNLTALTELVLHTPSCSAFVLSQLLRLEVPIALTLRPSTCEYPIRLRNYTTPAEVSPSIVTALTLENFRNMDHFRMTTKPFWNLAKRFSLYGIRVTDIGTSLRLPTVVTHLTLEIQLEDEHTGINNERPCGNGLFDHHFTGPHGLAITEDAPPRLTDLTALRDLKIMFTHSSGLRWRSPSLSKCFASRILDKLPLLERFECNEISRPLLHYLADRSGADWDFSYEVSVCNE